MYSSEEYAMAKAHTDRSLQLSSEELASIAMLLAVAANLVVALIVHDVIRRQSRHLQFPGPLTVFDSCRLELQGLEKF
jgi:hypothetical protein